MHLQIILKEIFIQTHWDEKSYTLVIFKLKSQIWKITLGMDSW